MPNIYCKNCQAYYFDCSCGKLEIEPQATPRNKSNEEVRKWLKEKKKEMQKDWITNCRHCKHTDLVIEKVKLYRMSAKFGSSYEEWPTTYRKVCDNCGAKSMKTKSIDEVRRLNVYKETPPTYPTT